MNWFRTSLFLYSYAERSQSRNYAKLTFILCWLYGFVRRQILIINNVCLRVYRHSENLYTKPAVIKLPIYTKLTKKNPKHSSLNQNVFFYKRALISTLPFKNDSCFNKDLYNFKKSNREIMLKNKSEVLANYHKSSLVLKSIIHFLRKKQTKIANPFLFQNYMFLVTLEHNVCPSHQWLTEFIIITCHSLTSWQ